jgi:hypothetical protein
VIWLAFSDPIGLSLKVSEIQSEQPAVQGAMAVGRSLKLRRMICE